MVPCIFFSETFIKPAGRYNGMHCIDVICMYVINYDKTRSSTLLIAVLFHIKMAHSEHKYILYFKILQTRQSGYQEKN